MLVDEKATSQAVRAALFDWLGQALEEDTVTIFFSGHGTPAAPGSPNLFLVTHDTDYGRVAATAFPMWDVETAIKRFIKAGRVVVIADACHAGGVGAGQAAGVGGKAVLAEAARVTAGLQELGEKHDGVAILTSANAKQLSFESREWGGGHGVFTHFLLKGLNGEADTDNDHQVTLGELTTYVSQNVRRATKNEQSPEVTGRFDPSLTIGK